MNKSFFFILCATLIGCDLSLRSPDSTLRESSPMRDSLRLIDQGRPEEAAVLLEEINLLHPEDDEVAVALASAYAGIAGLKIASYYDLFRDILFSRPLTSLPGLSGSEKFRTMIGKKGTVEDDRFEKNRQSLSAMSELRSSLLMVLALSDTLDRLPNVSEEKQMFLSEAIVILERLQSPKRAHFAYRALLRATLIKNELKQKLQHGRTCDESVFELIELIRRMKEKLESLLTDVALAFPRERTQLKQILASIDRSVRELDVLAQVQGKIAWAKSIEELRLSDDAMSCGAH